MALVVESGQGLADAEAYTSVAVFLRYMERRGLSAPATSSEADLEGALVRGSEAVDGLFGRRWLGIRATPGQALDWPRTGVYVDRLLLDPLSIPVALIKAVCEAAWREVAAPGSMLPDQDTSTRVTSESVGPLSVTYAEPTEAEKAGAGVAFASINKLLDRLTTSGSGVGGRSVYAHIRRA